MTNTKHKVVDYDWSQLDELVLAYAISIHKSQGSEYPAVVIPILSQTISCFSEIPFTLR